MASNAPIIIKRKKKGGGDGHHGGAWNVAYADFVMAMMAFFMLMLLLNATTETQRNGLADYFNPAIPMAKLSGGGDGVFGGDDVASNDQFVGRAGGAQVVQSSGAGAGQGAEAALSDALGDVKDQLDANSGESTVADDLLQHIDVRITDEGLIVDMFDLPGAPLFEPERDTPTALGRELIAVVSDIFRLAENRVAVNGHVRAQPVVRVERAEWDLSAARAQKTRILMTGNAISADRIARIGGFADRNRLHKAPTDPRNNRIELILLR